MDKLTKKLINDNTQMKSLLISFFEYAEKDEKEKIYTFPDVVLMLNEDEYNEMEKIINN